MAYRDVAQQFGDLITRKNYSAAWKLLGTIWVITEDLRGEGGGPITTVLFPEDY
jgi:hypothetical protein